MRHSLVTLFVVCLLGSCLPAPEASAQGCTVTPTEAPCPKFFDAYVPGGDNRDKACGARMFNLDLMNFGSKMQLFSIVGCGMKVWDVDNGTPSSPRTYNLWTWGTVYPHNTYRLWKLSMLDNFPYGLASYTSEGWVLFKVSYSSSGGVTSVGSIQHVEFGAPNTQMSGWQISTHMWRGKDQHVYAIGNHLDINGPGVAIVDLGTGTSDPTWPLPVKSKPVLKSPNQWWQTFEAQGKIWMYQWGGEGLHIYDVTDPGNLKHVATHSELEHIDPRAGSTWGPVGGIWGNRVVAKPVQGGVVYRVYTRTMADDNLHIYDVSTDPANPRELASISGLTEEYGIPISSVASDGSLMAGLVDLSFVNTVLQPDKMIRLFSVSDDSFVEIPTNINWYMDQDATTFENQEDIEIVPLGDKYYVHYSTKMRGYTATVSSGCVSTTPQPGILVTRASTEVGNPSCTAPSGAAKGYPGDTFTITNESAGQWTFGSLTVTGPNGYTSAPLVFNTQGKATWVAPNTDASVLGGYTVTLVLHDSAGGGEYSATAPVQLCGNPTARLAIVAVQTQGAGAFNSCTSCAYLQGDTIRLSTAGSDGHPVWAIADPPNQIPGNPVWTLEFMAKDSATWVAVESFTPHADGTVDLPLAAAGEYRASAAVTFPFLQNPLTAGPVTAHSGAVTASMRVTQDGSVVAEGGTILSEPVVGLTFTGTSVGNSATCDWKIDTTSLFTSPPLCTTAQQYDPGALTETTHTLSVVASTTTPPDTASASLSFVFKKASAPSAPQLVAPTDGFSQSPGSVTFSWTASTGTAPITYKVLSGPVTLCSSAGDTTCTATLSSAGTYTWFVRATNNLGSADSTTRTLVITQPAGTAPSKPVPTSPANNATVPVGKVTFTWSASTGTTPITYTVSTEETGTVCTSTGTTCSGNLTAGSYLWKITAKNAWGTGVSSSRVLTVSGSAGTAPSAPVLVSPAAGANVPSGQVVFSWNASTGSAPITYRVIVGPAQLCSVIDGTSCTGTLSTAGSYTWYVQATNSIGSASSATRALTVISSGAPSTPSLVSPANNASVDAGTVPFYWNASTGTTPITYKVIISGVQTVCTTTATSCNASLQAGSVTWAVQATNSVGSATSTSRSLTVKNVCVIPGAATTPTPANNATVMGGAVNLAWVAPTTGTAPFTYDVYRAGPVATKVCSDLTVTQCQLTDVPDDPPMEYIWYVVAKGCGGQTATPTQWRFTTCPATAAPVAGFTWTPNATVTINGVVQEQPYEGQVVTFVDQSTNLPSTWDWTDFNTPAPWVHYTTQSPTHTWTTLGNKTVRLTVSNCIGTSQQVSKTVKVSADKRPVAGRFGATPSSPEAGQVVTFAADTGDDVGNPTRFKWDFGDGSAAVETTNPSVTHTYECGRTYTVKLVATRTKSLEVVSTPGELSLVVGGNQCSPDALLVADVARNVPGVNNSLWFTDVDLYNPTAEDMKLRLAIKCNKAPAGASCDDTLHDSPSFLLRAGESTDLETLLAGAGSWPGYQEWIKGSVWVFRADGDEWGMPLPVVSARTHTGSAPPYDDFGQFEGVYSMYLTAQESKTVYITGAQHNGKIAQQQLRGFRTNLTFAEAAGKPIATGKIKITLMKVDDPLFVKQKSLPSLAPFAYMQWPVWKLVDGVGEEEDLGRIILKIEMAPGTTLAMGCSLVNNATNSPIFIPPQTAP